MSGLEFCNILNQINYPATSRLDPNSLDWCFDHPKVKKFMIWFCNNVSKKNLINPDDVELFNKLVSSGEEALDGDKLDSALQSLANIEGRNVDCLDTTESLKKEIDQLEKELSTKTKWLKNITLNRDKLLLRQTGIHENTSRIETELRSSNHKLKNILDPLVYENTKRNNIFAQIDKSIIELSTIFNTEQEIEAKMNKESTKLLSENYSGRTIDKTLDSCLKEYYLSEDKYFLLLSDYAKKLFREEELLNKLPILLSSCTIENTTSIQNASVAKNKEKESIFLNFGKELLQYQESFSKLEKDLVKENVKIAGENTKSKYLDDLMRNWKLISFSDNQDSMRSQYQKLEEERIRSENYLETWYLMISKEVETLAEKHVELILDAHCKVMIKQQLLHISNQSKMIGLLIEQRSRNELIKHLLESDIGKQKQIDIVIRALETILATEVSDKDERLNKLKPFGNSFVEDSNVEVPSDDSCLIRLNSILNGAKNNSTGQMMINGNTDLKYSDIVLMARELTDSLYEFKMEENIATKNLQNNTNSMMSQVENSCSNIFKVFEGADDSLLVSMPSMIGHVKLALFLPRPITQGIKSLEHALSNLETSVKAAVEDIESKKKTLKERPLLLNERNIYVLFLTDPDSLKKMIGDLKVKTY